MSQRLCSLLLLPLLLAAAPPRSLAQDPVPPPAAQAPETSVAALQAKLAAITADTTLAADLKATLAEVLGRALESAKATEAQLQAQQRYAVARSSAAARLAERTAELQAIETRKPGPPAGDLTLAQLEQGLLLAQQAQADAKRLGAELDRETTRRAERRTAIPIQLGETRARLDALPAQVAEAGDVEPRLLVARRLLLQAERARLQTEIDTLDAELQSYDAEVLLLRTEGDLAARRATAAKADADAWQAVLQPLRAAEAQRAEREAQASVVRADPRVVSLANGNADLAKAVAKLVELRERVEREKSERDAERLRLQQDFDETKKRAELVGATDAVGALLRQRRLQLAETSRGNQQRTRSRRDGIADAQLLLLDFDEQRRRLVADPETWLQQELGGHAVAASLPDYVIAEARRLRDARRGLLRQLTEGYSSLLNTQIDVANTEHQLSDLIQRYRSFVTERVLGIRSSPPIWQTDWQAAREAVAWLTDLPQWRAAGRLWLAGLLEDGWPFALLVPLLLLFGLRFVLHRRLVQHGDVAIGGSNVAYLPTALAAIDTLLLALPLPALLWLFGWRLGVHPENSDFAKAIATAATEAASVLLLVTMLRCLLLPKGLAEAHFRWQTTTLSHLRRAQRMLLVALVPFSFVLATLEAPGEDRWLGSLGSLLLMGQLTLLVVAFWRLLHPSTGLIGGSVSATAGLLHRLRTLWFLLGVGTPATLLLMVALGYDYTALQLARRIEWTVGALLLGVLVHAMILRGLVLERRRLQMRSTQERLQAAKTGEAAGGAGELAAAEAPDPQSLARQTQTLLRGAIVVAVAIAAFQIWIDVLPALGVLRRVELWSGGTETMPVVVTLADLLASLFVLLAAGVAASNLPAMLELLVLQRLRMQAGERHAVTTLARYGIVIVGIVMAFSSIGIGWGKVQWLVAAVSVGLGFGLQEVFANFVSGLILLFERPVRVGDIVTVGDTTGKVTRIRIRATTIQDWDRKELVVPNREFVTGHFVNWTLSDPIVRWTIVVGVAYGTDTIVALKLLEQAAAESRAVLKEPRPEATFTSFGDSSLVLKLRVFFDMNAFENRWLTDLHQAIDAKFRAAGVTIAFPQSDVNLKVEGPVLELLRTRRHGQPTA